MKTGLSLCWSPEQNEVFLRSDQIVKSGIFAQRPNRGCMVGQQFRGQGQINSRHCHTITLRLELIILLIDKPRKLSLIPNSLNTFI